jgi:signal transduction histidine kinase
MTQRIGAFGMKGAHADRTGKRRGAIFASSGALPAARPFYSVPPHFLSYSDDGAPGSTARPRFLARLIAALVRPPAHGRLTSIVVVVGLSVLIGLCYVWMQGRVSMQGFYLVPLIFAVSWLGLGWGVFISLLTALFRMLGDIATTALDPNYYFADADLSRVVSNRVSGLFLYLLVVVVIHELIVLSRQLEQRVQARTDALRQAVAARERVQNSLFEAGMRERSAIGRDLHDGLGQHLTATAMAARIISSRLSARNDVLAPDARQVEALIKAGIDQTRHIARGLLLESVKPDELCSELEELAVTATQNHRIPCVLTADGPAERLDVNTASHLFYIAREALRNALRHGAATRVAIHLAVERATAELTVTDDGCGIRPEGRREGGMGLHIMAQRAEFLGGVLHIHAPAGGGTRVECRVPLSGAAGA